VKGKNHGHQPATISLSQEFWVTRLWRLTRESSLRRRASAPLRQKPSLYPGVNLEQLQQVFHMVVQAMEHINNHLKLLMASLPLQLLSGLPPPYSAPPYFLPHLHIFEKYGQLSHEMNITCRVYSGKWMETASQG